jgi:carbon monoxide dehydrogenase subunit G
MQIENEFTVPAPVDRVWDQLLDVERVAPCMPGAELTEVVDDRTWRGVVNVKLGPVSLSFAGSVVMQERDDASHRVVLLAKGLERRGKGAANATVTSWLEPADGLTTVRMQADVQLTGAVAQLSRGLLPEVSRKLTQQFAECLRTGMSSSAGPVARAEARPKAIGGVRLGLSAIRTAITSLLRRLLGARRP